MWLTMPFAILAAQIVVGRHRVVAAVWLKANTVQVLLVSLPICTACALIMFLLGVRWRR
jgi:hypothetical protein